MEKEQYQTEIRDLQDQLSEMHDELDVAKQSQTDSTEKEAIIAVHDLYYTKHITFVCPAEETCLDKHDFPCWLVLSSLKWTTTVFS